MGILKNKFNMGGNVEFYRIYINYEYYFKINEIQFYYIKETPQAPRGFLKYYIVNLQYIKLL